MRALRTYAALLRLPGAPRAVLPALLARSTYAMAGLALLLFIHARTGSFASAGLVVGAYSLASAASAPVLGRAVDRLGATRVLGVAAIVYPVALLSLLVVPHDGWLPLVCAAAGGAAQPPTGPAMRAMWPALTPDPALLAAAYNFESVLVETVFVAGPLLVGLLVATAGTTAALVGTAGVMCVGTLGFVSAPVVRRRPRRDPAQLVATPLSSSAVRSVLLVILLVAASFGALEVAVAGFATQHGASSRSGLLLATWALGSFSGGLWYGGRARPSSPGHRYLLLVSLIGVTFVPLALARTGAELAALLFVAGLAVAPTGTEEFGLIGRHAPPGSATEAFTWATMLMAVGGSFGNAAGGFVQSRHGSTLTFLLGAALALLGAAAAVAQRARIIAPVRVRAAAAPVPSAVPEHVQAGGLAEHEAGGVRAIGRVQVQSGQCK